MKSICKNLLVLMLLFNEYYVYVVGKNFAELFIVSEEWAAITCQYVRTKKVPQPKIIGLLPKSDMKSFLACFCVHGKKHIFFKETMKNRPDNLLCEYVYTV